MWANPSSGTPQALRVLVSVSWGRFAPLVMARTFVAWGRFQFTREMTVTLLTFRPMTTWYTGN